MKNNTSKTVYVPTDAEVLDPQKYPIQWMIYRNVVMSSSDMSRRKLLDEISISFARAGNTIFRYKDGTPYHLPDLDEVFGNDDDMRWLSYYLESDESGNYPLRISRKPERLRILNLFLKLKYPKFTRHLEK